VTVATDPSCINDRLFGSTLPRRGWSDFYGHPAEFVPIKFKAVNAETFPSPRTPVTSGTGLDPPAKALQSEQV
jgi:hypothetical protein